MFLQMYEYYIYSFFLLLTAGAIWAMWHISRGGYYDDPLRSVSEVLKVVHPRFEAGTFGSERQCSSYMRILHHTTRGEFPAGLLVLFIFPF